MPAIVLMFMTFDSKLEGRLRALDLPPEARQQLEEEKINLGAAEVPESLDAGLRATVERAIDEAFVSGYRSVLLLAAAIALATALSAAFLIEDKKLEERVAKSEMSTSTEKDRVPILMD